jgi:hypothetical protein
MQRSLSQGCTGADVRQLQRLLNFHLPWPWWPRLRDDGNFGPRTRAKVIEFQTVNDCASPKGVVDPETLHALLDVRETRFYARLDPRKFPLDSEPPASAQNAGGGQVGQRTIQLQWPTAQLNVNPFFLQRLAISGQVNWVVQRQGDPDFTLSLGGQFALNQKGFAGGAWTGQGYAQMGPSSLFKRGNFDLLNPSLVLMLQKNQDQAATLGVGIGNQFNYTLSSVKDPSNPANEIQNLSLFLNTQLVLTSCTLSGPDAGKCVAPAFQVLGGVIWTFDWIGAGP